MKIKSTVKYSAYPRTNIKKLARKKIKSKVMYKKSAYFLNHHQKFMRQLWVIKNDNF
jgi:hypothetical protein